MFVEEMDRFFKRIGTPNTFREEPWTNIKNLNAINSITAFIPPKPVDKIEVNLAGVDPSTIQVEWTKYSTDEGTLLTVKYGDGKDKKYIIDKIFDASKTKLTYSHGLLTINFVEKESNVKTGVLKIEY